MSFDEALVKLNKDSCPGEGFYTSKRVSTGWHLVNIPQGEIYLGGRLMDLLLVTTA